MTAGVAATRSGRGAVGRFGLTAAAVTGRWPHAAAAAAARLRLRNIRGRMDRTGRMRMCRTS